MHSFKIAPKYVIAFMLLLINSVHFMVVTYFQIPGNIFNAKFEHSLTTLQLVFFGIAVMSTVFYPMIVRNLSLKSTLIGALSCDVLGVLCFGISTYMGGHITLIMLGTIFMALSFLTACISVVTYLVLEFPKQLGASLLAIFAFGDMGNICANLLFNAFNGDQESYNFYFLSIPLLLSFIAFIAMKFFDPVYPKHLSRLRESSFIWKELHYRLAFFLLASVGYGIVESVFAVWGEVYLLKFFFQNAVTSTISLFWFMMMIGKFLLLLPLLFFSMSRIFPLLIIGIIFAIIYIEKQTSLSGFILGFGTAGIFLAAVMPMIIASMENEIIATSSLSHKRNYLPYIEIGTALTIGAHFCGVGLMTLFVEMASNIASSSFFHGAIFIAASVGLIIGFLNWSSSLSRT